LRASVARVARHNFAARSIEPREIVNGSNKYPRQSQVQRAADIARTIGTQQAAGTGKGEWQAGTVSQLLARLA
jgi:hypothetical protein